MSPSKVWPDGLGRYKVDLVDRYTSSDRLATADGQSEEMKAYHRGLRDAFYIAINRLDQAMKADGYTVA